MRKKAGKYINYIVKFVKSPNKKVIVKELSAEIKTKGFLHGVRSILHKKVHGKNYREASGQSAFSIISFDKKTKIVLPAVTSPKVSIIIPMYGQLDYTINCIYSIYRNNEFKDYEIIIADDNPADDTTAIAAHFENVIVLKNKVNLGFLKNCNNAAAAASGEYIVFLNNDTQVQKNWLAELLVVFENFDRVGLVGSKLVYPDGRLQEAGGIIWKDGSGWNYGNGDNPSKPEYNYVKEADYISGASIMISTALWKEIGGFDELFAPAYCEDSDLCFQVRKKGFKAMYQPFSVVVHFEGVTHGTSTDKGIKQYQVINQKKLIERWARELSQKSPNGENVFTERDRTGGQKHVLVVDHYLPQIDKDAGSRTISNFIDSMLGLGYNVKFLGENQNMDPRYQVLFQQKGVEVLYGPPYHFSDQSWKKYLKEYAAEFDAILLSRSHVCAPIMAFLRSINYPGKIIYYGHDLGYLRLEKEAAITKDNNLLAHAKKMKAAEDFMYQNADYSFVISQEETDYLKKFITRPLKYVPPYFYDVTRDIASFEEREGLFFIGGFNHPPNRDAMQWFLDEVYEPLYKTGIKLTIAGSKMPKEFYAYKDKFNTLRILPDVTADKLEQLYAEARIVIVPLRSGAGVKGKVIEAMAKGVPVVGTDIAFEGMPKGGDFMYTGVNAPGVFTRHLLEVYKHEVKWIELSEFGLKYVDEYFNKEKMKQVFKEVIE